MPESKEEDRDSAHLVDWYAYWQPVGAPRRRLASILGGKSVSAGVEQPGGHEAWGLASPAVNPICKPSASRKPGGTLRVVYGPGIQVPLAVPLRPDRAITIGRDQEPPDFCIDDRTISRRHAIIYWCGDHGAYHIIDQNSRNGVHINGVRVNAAYLAAGDLIRLGEALLVFTDEFDDLGFKRAPLRPSRERMQRLLRLLADLTHGSTSEFRLTAEAAEVLLLEETSPIDCDVELPNETDAEAVHDLRVARNTRPSRKHNTIRARVNRWMMRFGIGGSNPRS